MTRELLRAHRAREQEAVRAVRMLLKEIDDAWNQIPQDMRG